MISVGLPNTENTVGVSTDTTNRLIEQHARAHQTTLIESKNTLLD